MSIGLSYDEYKDKFRGMVRRELSFEKSAKYVRGFDREGNLRSTDGRVFQTLIPPEILLHLQSRVVDLTRAINMTKARMYTLLGEIVETGSPSEFVVGKLQILDQLYKKQLADLTVIKDSLSREARGVGAKMLDYQKVLREASDNLEALSIRKKELYAEQSGEYAAAAQEYCKLNKVVLDATHEIDTLAEDLWGQEAFVISSPALLHSDRFLPEDIRVKLR